MKYYYENTVYGNKRKNQLTCNINYTSKGKRVWLHFGVKVLGDGKNPKEITICHCHKDHYLNRLSGFLTEEEYKEYIPEVEEKAREFYKLIYEKEVEF